MPSNRFQSMSLARCASTEILQPSRSATSRSRCELEEFGAPISNKKIRDLLGFKEQHDWRKYVKV